MAPLPCIDLNRGEQAQLLGIARQSITVGLETRRELALEAEQFEGSLTLDSAVFVTLTDAGQLRGCVGSLQAAAPLVQAVASAAFNAAYRDRRFRPLRGDEIEVVKIEVSVLSAMQPINAQDRDALLESLQPGVDGLLLEDRGYRATFLPKVWEKIPSPPDFLDQLLLKAGLPADHWSNSLCCRRYRTLTFAES